MHNELHCYISQIGLVLKITKDESVLIAAHQIKTISPYYSEKKKKIKWLLWIPNMRLPFPEDQLFKWNLAVTLNMFGCRYTSHVSSLNSPLVLYSYLKWYNSLTIYFIIFGLLSLTSTCICFWSHIPHPLQFSWESYKTTPPAHSFSHSVSVFYFTYSFCFLSM